MVDIFPRQCTKVCCETIIKAESNVSEEQLARTFQNVKHLVGSLHVSFTEYESLKFLESLETLECGTF